MHARLDSERTLPPAQHHPIGSRWDVSSGRGVSNTRGVARGVSSARGMDGAIPSPVRAMRCGLPGALSVIVKDPLRGPTPCGLNSTTIVQLVSGLTGDAAHVSFTTVKSSAFAPLGVTRAT